MNNNELTVSHEPRVLQTKKKKQKISWKKSKMFKYFKKSLLN